MEAKRRLGQPRYYECNHCKASFGETYRARLRCGWIAREQWAEKQELRPVAGLPVPTLQVCPGYAQHCGKVRDVYAAWSWWEKGQLTVRYPEPTEQLMELIELANGSIHGANDWYLDEVQRESKRR